MDELGWYHEAIALVLKIIFKEESFFVVIISQISKLRNNGGKND